MANRTFGWIQNPSSTDTLRDILGLFVPGSEFHTYMVNERLPLLASAGLFKTPSLYMEFQKILRTNKPIAFDILKGQGAGRERRAKAKCSGLAQAAITGQQFKEYIVDGRKIRIKKPYTDDWSADGFLRWAVSLGFLDYNYADDTCRITESGVALVMAKTTKDKNSILGQAYLSYPPVCRVLGLLASKGHMTKFEIGSQLGFTDEAGFTSFPQNIWVQAYEESTDDNEKKTLRSDTEGSSDKYARMICGWLEAIGWVNKRPKTVRETFGSKTYTCVIASAFDITSTGIINYNKALGKSNSPRVPKFVYREMLASKASDANYLRMRRSLILAYLSNHTPRSVDEIRAFLVSKNIEEKWTTIKDDMSGLINIGMDIEHDGKCYKLNDKIEKLIPYQEKIAKDITDAVIAKDRARLRLQHIDHKYLTLIDYAFSGKNKCTDFEVYTIDLLVNELAFNGIHLGGTRKPDGIFYHGNNGVIIDNKAYSKGFTITRGMADEMTRYVQENNDRNPERNPNQWWLNFGDDVNHFNFVFISSLFKGEIKHMLNNIKQSTGIDGCVLTAENLLYYADAIKGGDMQKSVFMSQLGAGQEIVCPNYRL
ncbi:restriction endonuclease FokI C-terminal domain-containing protein [Sodaliphilus sp.]|uniref:restriction endonuclease FokI C-terminal domain-containing protein n=1 Tax=Sodaliphilus sp. TaxID=2815818 RepID=UPI00388D6A61